jgi:chemotaxis protein methyltransferase CheR
VTNDELPLAELAAAVGLPLASYRPKHVGRQLERAKAREQVGSWRELLLRIQRDDEARARIRRTVAVSVTGLFRDPEQFDLLERNVLPELARRFDRIRVWSAGCADGSEVLSLAILLRRLGCWERTFILGSDLLPENIELARRKVAAELGSQTSVRLEVRDLLASERPPGRFALILCRNLAIYLEPEAKRKLHAMLAAALMRNGVLVLGRAERLSDPLALGLTRAGPHHYCKA